MGRLGDWLGDGGVYIVIGLVVVALLVAAALRCTVGPKLLAAAISMPFQVVILLGGVDTIMDGHKYRDQDQVAIGAWAVIATTITIYVLSRALL